MTNALYRVTGIHAQSFMDPDKIAEGFTVEKTLDKNKSMAVVDRELCFAVVTLSVIVGFT